MGGWIITKEQDQIEGVKLGLTSNFSLSDLTVNSEVKDQIDLGIGNLIALEQNRVDRFKIEHKKKKSIEFCLGFDYGFDEGRRIRLIIENTKYNGLTVQENIDYCEYLISKQGMHYREEVHNNFLQNIENWGITTLPIEICQMVLKLLDERKIQRALIETHLFYEKEFKLKGSKEIKLLIRELRAVRIKKRENSSFNTSEGKNEIEFKLRTWIKQNSN